MVTFSTLFLHPTLLIQCAMCKTGAEAAGEASIAAGINLGILVLLVPPVALFCAIFWTAYKLQEPSRESEND